METRKEHPETEVKALYLLGQVPPLTCESCKNNYILDEVAFKKPQGQIPQIFRGIFPKK